MIICGIGGQGNVLASEIVSSTLNDMGYRVAVGETYGASQRGGSVMSHVRVSETEDFGVLIPSGEAHIIIGFEPLETLRMARQYANKETMIIYDPRPVYPLGVLQGNQAYPPVEEISKELLALARKPMPSMLQILPWKSATPEPPTSFCSVHSAAFRVHL